MELLEGEMIEVFYGEDRAGAQKEVSRVLGEGYEVVDGEGLLASDLPSLFQGATLFSGGGVRRILVKDVSGNAEVFGRLADYVATEHLVVILEQKLDKRTAGWRKLSKAGVKAREFRAVAKVDPKMAFGIFETAMRDGGRAVKMCEEIEGTQDAFMFVGLLTSQAIKQFSWRGGARERRILKELARLDLNMKSTRVAPWDLVKGFLLRVGTF